jgi:hypothetical protein
MANNQRKDYGYTLDLIKNAKVKSSREAIQSISALRQTLKSLKLQGISEAQIYKVKQASYDAIKQDLLSNNLAERQALEDKLDTIKNAYERDYQKNYETHHREVDAARRRYAAMSKKELFAEADRYLRDGFPKDVDPGIIDELSINLKSNGYEMFDTMREVMIKNNYDKPYFHNEVAEDILGDLQFISTDPKYVFLKTEDGKRVNRDIADIEEFLALEDSEQGEE